ncbi:MAG: PilZ domain-containing protein [Proteobacteria bacterium]|nr:PilZ domain-containing protein [Pseudomonadota bacterium]
MEKRRHQRLHLQLPIRFIVEQPETRDSQSGQGMLKDISYGGILFQVKPPLPVQPGHVREFSFFLTPEKKKERDLEHFQARGLVLRIELPDQNSSAYGVAVQFLSALVKKDVTDMTITMSLYPQRRVRTGSKPIQDAR